MKYCKKCKKLIESKEDSYNGLCFNCYKEYLFEKIEHIGDEDYEIKFSSKNKFKKLINFIKKWFNLK